MNHAVMVLFLFDFILMCALPRIFFKRGKLGLMWWVTASPFGISALFLILQSLGITHTLVEPTSQLGDWLAIASVPFGALSAGLVFATIASHKVPLALWHQKDDAPVAIVTHGPYSKVRHPFYSSFLLLLLGSAIFSPQWGTFACLLAGLAILTATARREEKRLLASQFGAEYAAYQARTGRFFPRVIAGAGAGGAATEPRS